VDSTHLPRGRTHDDREAHRTRGNPDSRRSDRRQLQDRPVSLRRIGRLFADHRAALGLVVALIVASSLIGLAQPFLVRHVIDVALPRRDVGLLVWCVAGMIGVAVASAALGIFQTLVSTRIGQQVMHRLRSDLFAHLQRQSVDFFTRTRGGEVQSRMVNDIGSMQSVVTSTATAIAANVTVVVGTVIAMFALDWRLALISLIVLPPAVITTRQVARMRYAVTAARQQKLADLHVQVEEGLSVSGILLTKTLGAAPTLARRFEETSHDLVDLEIRSQLAGRWRMATMQVVFAAVPAALYLAAGLPATREGLTIGTLVAFVSLQGSLFRPLMGLLNVGVDVTSSLALFSRIFEYLDLPVRIGDPTAPVRLDDVRGEVRFDHVTFSYDADSPVLRDVDLTVPAGTSLALVGATGSGKSTLAGLVARLHDPDSGRVTLDGVDLRDLVLTDLADAVGVVTQETYLLHATVRDNLRHARRRHGDRGRRPGRADPRPHHLAPRRLRHDGGIPGAPVLRGRAAAAGHRAYPLARPTRPRPRRGHQRPGQHDRARGAGGTGRPRPRSDDHHHRPPALDRPQRRPDRRARPRAGRRARHARGAAARGRTVCRPGARRPPADRRGRLAILGR
jgi:ATP-binding cassette subfamily B protein